MHHEQNLKTGRDVASFSYMYVSCVGYCFIAKFSTIYYHLVYLKQYDYDYMPYLLQHGFV